MRALGRIGADATGEPLRSYFVGQTGFASASWEG
jgi:hypothetical protein